MKETNKLEMSNKQKKIAIMQPYFLPYIGYFQLINAVDEFVVYDNIQFSKRGWINRNRYQINGKEALFSVPIKKDSDYLDVVERVLADDYMRLNGKTLRKLQEAYKKAPFFMEVWPVLNSSFLYSKSINLFDFIFNSIKLVLDYLEVNTEVTISSTIKGLNEDLIAVDRVLDISSKIQASTYINPIGGKELYNKQTFKKQNIELKFHQVNELWYDQKNASFLPNLSIIDVMMYNSPNEIKKMLNDYTLS